jgi:hypothetical protein
LLCRGLSNLYELDTHGSLHPGAFPGVDAQRIEKVPYSRAYKAKQRAWQAVHAKIVKEEQAQERRRMQVMLALAECFGVMAGNLREQPDGVELVGGQFFGTGGLTRALDLGVEQFTVARGSERTWELYSQRSALEDELRKIRIVDVATALRVPTPLE